MRARKSLIGVALVGLITLGFAGSAMANHTITQLLDVTPTPGCSDTTCGIQWVVQDRGTNNLIIGSAFVPGGLNSILHNTIAAPTSWELDASWQVGEALYIALHPNELRSGRRVHIATENNGWFGHFNPVNDSITPFQATGANRCGTSIGFLPGRDLAGGDDAVYFGFVECHGFNKHTEIYKRHLSSSTASFVATIFDRRVNGPWVLIQDTPTTRRLYNMALNQVDTQACLLRQDSDTSYPDVFCHDLTPNLAPQGTHWSHAFFANGFYHSEFDETGADSAKVYRIVSNPDGSCCFAQVFATTAQSTTFLVDTVRSQLFVFVTYLRNYPPCSGVQCVVVACSRDGVTFLASDFVAGNRLYGPTGSVATVWNTNPIKVVWGHTPTSSRLIPTHGLVLASTLTCP